MKKIQTAIDGVYIIQHDNFKDNRGVFVKTYNLSTFAMLDLDLEIKERYFSISHKNVIRGMHFQIPPKDHVKLVSIIHGSILDVVLDIRTASPTYGQCYSFRIKAEEWKTIYIPEGFAHGFKALQDNTIVEYNQTTEYDPICDDGILFDSFGFDWNIENPITSKRDLGFVPFLNFRSPF